MSGRRSTGRRAPRLVRAILRLLPERCRDELADPLEVTVLDALEAASERGPRARIWTYVRETAGLARLVIREHRDDVRSRTSGEGVGFMLGQDIRFALRSLRRSPASTFVGVATLALGIGAVTAIASVIDGVMLRNLAYAEPDRVAYIGERTPDGGFTSASYENLRDWEAAGIFQAVGATIGNSVSVTGDGSPQRIRGEFVTAGYFEAIGVHPVVGRAIAPGEDEPGGPRAAVLSWGWWQERFGGDPAALGRTVMLNNEPHTIVGVMPQGFRSPWDTPQAWISVHTIQRPLDRRTRHFQAVVARLRPDQTLEGAEASLASLAEGLAERYPDTNQGWGTWARDLGPFLAERNRPFLLGLAAAVTLLLLIACANVANLQLARTAARRRELAVRTALGGGRFRLARLLVVENAVVFLLGGIAGLGVAWLAVGGLLELEPAYTLFYDVRLSGAAAGVGLAVAAVTGLLFGLAPALEGFRGGSPTAALGEGDGRSGSSRGARRFRSGLVVAQLGLSVSLLVGAGLLARTMSALMGVDPGFERERLLTLEFRLPQNRYGGDAERLVFYDDLHAELEALPGVEAVGFASDLPFSGNGGTMRVLPEGSTLAWEDAPTVRASTVSPGYRATMGIPLLEGRDLAVSDEPGAPFAVLVSRSAAERHFGGSEAVGTTVYASADGNVSGRIVGVVGDVQTSLTQPPDPYLYVSYRQSPSLFMSVAIRTVGTPMELAPAVREAVWRVDADQPVWEVMPIEQRMAGSASRTRLNAVLVLSFALTALLLASLGLYGVMAYSVRQQERELGVRVALGASPSEITRMVMGRGMVLIALGLAAGLVVGWWLASLLESLLFGVSASDPVTFAAATAALALVGALSTYVPVRRALRVDPVEALQRA